MERLSKEGAKYCKSVYIAFFDEKKKLVIGNVGFMGASIGPWIDFCKDNNVLNIGVQVKSSVSGKKGKVEFESPIFETLKITPETNAEAEALDKELQVYLTSYFERKGVAVEAKAEPASVENKPVKPTVEQTTQVMDELFGAEEDNEPPF